MGTSLRTAQRFFILDDASALVLAALLRRAADPAGSTANGDVLGGVPYTSMSSFVGRRLTVVATGEVTAPIAIKTSRPTAGFVAHTFRMTAIAAEQLAYWLGSAATGETTPASFEPQPPPMPQ